LAKNKVKSGAKIFFGFIIHIIIFLVGGLAIHFWGTQNYSQWFFKFPPFRLYVTNPLWIGWISAFILGTIVEGITLLVVWYNATHKQINETEYARQAVNGLIASASETLKTIENNTKTLQKNVDEGLKKIDDRVIEIGNLEKAGAITITGSLAKIEKRLDGLETKKSKQKETEPPTESAKEKEAVKP
jgi:CHASE3 domain sensor protein